MLDRMARLDRRIIFLILAVSVALPVLFPIGLPVTPGEPVTAAYKFIESIPNGSYGLLSFDYGPATKVECHPMAVACLHQCFRKDIKVVAMAMFEPAGQALAREALHEVAPVYGKAEGRDYVNLGYKAGNEAVTIGLGLNMRSTFPTDAHGVSIDDVPVMDKVRGLSDFAFVACWSAGRPGALEHIRFTHSAYGRPLILGVTAVTMTEYYPYYNSGQVVGLLGGLRGAAEYEELVGVRGTAQPGMDAQNLAHFVIAGFIVFSNMVYFSQLRARRRRP